MFLALFLGFGCTSLNDILLGTNGFQKYNFSRVIAALLEGGEETVERY